MRVVTEVVARGGFVVGLVIACFACERQGGPRDAGASRLASRALPGTEREALAVVEELRFGLRDPDGAYYVARIFSFEVDNGGKLWVLDGQAQLIRVFDADGRLVRTVGRRGSGPGEFRQAVRIERGPDGHLWVTDPGNARLTVLDTTGTFVRAVNVPLGCFSLPWPGRFGVDGRYMTLGGANCESLLRFDTSFQVGDTLPVPSDQREPEYFVHEAPSGRIRAEVPFHGSLVWRLSKRGTVWALLTGDYLLSELGASGNTVRTVTHEFIRASVSDADREFARRELQWFESQGGRIDWSRLPRRRPPIIGFFVADDGALWVERWPRPDSIGRVFDVLDDKGEFRSRVILPFALARVPTDPIVRDGLLYAVTADSSGREFVVRSRLVIGRTTQR